MNDPTPMAAADQQVLITRIFDAPRERVFKAWTDPDQVAAWYGPEHFDTPRERIHIDPRVGGMMPAKARSVVVLPAPLGPTSPMTLPPRTWNVSPLTATTSR